MCRLYGFRANEPTKVECTLVQAQNALMVQSRSDLRGKAHEDGWGIAYYKNSAASIEKRIAAAHEDLHFGVMAERVHSTTVVAHVRQATVGAITPRNTHPFQYGRWVFAHNGTVARFDHARRLLEQRIDAELLELRQGETDSELAFYWILSRLRRSGVDLDAGCDDPRLLAEALSDSVHALEAMGVGGEKPAKLNFLLTDGKVLVASRWRNSLFMVSRRGIRDCEVCGVPHVDHEPGSDYRAIVIASEPISGEDWQELPEGSVVVVTSDLQVERLVAGLPS